ncbi:hypothetical protein CBR_g11955 [Chara braunii]|uniref:CCHC-type domain-containing protein n=1 Tax=Chara braunii TaxID=69332 RepID=A0A388KQR3_CHABU|nr:hypothetical protein CBR_g11955 [Chara braunii]|eukprot:GBG72377.1 hypothetical protein CBR_g11955 [Chara braunii]
MGLGIMGKKVRATAHWSLGIVLTMVELCLRVGKGMASEEAADELRSKGSQGTGRGTERNEASVKDRESAKPQGSREDGKDLSTGESSGKAGSSKRGPQENRKGRDNGRLSPRNSKGATPKKTKISDVRCKLAEIEKRIAEYKARLMEEMMAGNERDSLGIGSREERRVSQGEIRRGGKDNNHKGTPSKKGKEKGDAPAVEAEKATPPLAMDNGTSRLPATPKVAKGCDGLWSLRERVLGWFDPEGTPKAGEKHGDSKEGEGTSPAQLSRPALPPQEAVVPATVANRGYGRRDPSNEQCRYCTMVGHFMWTCPRLNHDIMRQRCSRSLKGEILGPQGEHVNRNSLGGMRRVVIVLNNLDIVAVEAEPVADIVWDQPRGRGPQANFILEGNGQDRVNITTRRAGAKKKLIRDTVMEEIAGTGADQEETETGEQKVYRKAREAEPIDKVTTTKQKFRY